MLTSHLLNYITNTWMLSKLLYSAQGYNSMRIIALVLFLLLGANAFPVPPSFPARSSNVGLAARPIPPLEDFPPGYSKLKKTYRLWIHNECDDYGVFTWDEIADRRPGYIELMAHIQKQQSKVNEASRKGVNFRQEMQKELKHIFDCEIEYGCYEDWLNDMAHFENLPDYVQSLQGFLELVRTGSVSVSENESDSRIPSFLASYQEIFRKSTGRFQELLSDSDKQLELPCRPNVTGLRTIVDIVEEAIVDNYDGDGNCHHAPKLRSLVEFLLPLLQDFLPSSFSLVGS
jgi:hypothetical protein